MRCRDGQYKWVCSRGKVVERDEHGKPLRMIGTTIDITAMRRLSEQVQQTAAVMTDLTNEIPGMVFQLRRQADGESTFTYVSVGISTLNAGDASVRAALSRSDIALYCAKRGGRNRIQQH
nr:PAS domain-containing protein [Pseudomonas sp. Marseille-Q0931]